MIKSLRGILLAIFIGIFTIYMVLKTSGSLEIDYSNPQVVQQLINNLNK